MNTKLINSVADVINAALTQNRTAAGIALALDSAGFLAPPRNPPLTKARAAAATMLRLDTGQDRPTWRVIITDSESPTGIAPVCTGDRSDSLHMIDDYPGGPKRDEDGVYDCCPSPQIETCSETVATYLVELLNADTAARAAE